jgi:hypothetical protein
MIVSTFQVARLDCAQEEGWHMMVFDDQSKMIIHQNPGHGMGENK